jgi:peptidyl-prolyl cis-trans isomerase B (cyclophilin B)
MKWIGWLGCFIICSSCNKNLALFEISKLEENAPAQVDFKAISEVSESFNWQFGDGSIDTGKEVSHSFMNSGLYEISLTAKRKNKLKTITKTIMINPPEKCYVNLHTEFGDMLIELFDETPLHQENFLRLVKEGFYEELLFHRVIQGFMVQGGDPDSKGASPEESLGRGGPGYTIPAEFRDQFVHTKGAIAAARMGDAANPEKRSSGSQFYIVQGKPLDEAGLNQYESRKGKRYSADTRSEYLTQGGTPFLDYDYTVFGRVVEGLEVIDKIASVETGSGDRPKQDVKMSFKIIN